MGAGVGVDVVVVVDVGADVDVGVQMRHHTISADSEHRATRLFEFTPDHSTLVTPVHLHPTPFSPPPFPATPFTHYRRSTGRTSRRRRP